MKLVNFVFALSIATILNTSCSSEADEVLSHDDNMVFATFGVESENSAATRADLINIGRENANFRWNTGDLIAVSADGKDDFHPIEGSDPSQDNNTAKASGKVDKSTGGYLCVYPSSAAGTKVDKNRVHVSVPNDQVIEMQHFIAKNALLQVGYASGLNSQISMKTPCSFLAFNPGNNNILSVTVEAFNADGTTPYGIVGDIEVYKTATSSLDQEATGTSTNKVTCTYHNGTTYFPQEKYYAIAIRPGTYGKLKVTVEYDYIISDDPIKGKIFKNGTQVFNLTSTQERQLQFAIAVYSKLPSFGTLPMPED